MFEKLIEDLCQKEGLIDIGSFGVASQSSTSKWSRENDAQRAVSNVEISDYAFHTDKEENPWWQIEFDKPFNIIHLIINNRINPKYMHIAAKIIVIGYDECGNELILRKGSCVFGNLNNGVPLIISNYNVDNLCKIRIILPDNNYLHLSDINILAKLSLQQQTNKSLIFSNRPDGLGERLKGLLNAMVLSEYIKGDFKFSWIEQTDENNKFHSTGLVEDIFSSNFIRNHIVDRKVIGELNIEPIKKVPHIAYDKISIYDGLLVQQQNIRNQVKDKKFVVEKYAFRKAFNKIEFSGGINSAKYLAENANIGSKPVAIHLRAGDIVYGMYRFMDRYYNKVIPIYVLDELITKIHGLGYQVVIFGQEVDFCRLISRKHNAIYSGDLIDEKFNVSQEAIFDIVLMSRCEYIISGGSGFAILAGWIGDISNKYFNSYLTDVEIKKSFQESLSNDGLLSTDVVSDLLRSFSISHYFDMYKEKNNVEEGLLLIREAVQLDPENSF